MTRSMQPEFQYKQRGLGYKLTFRLNGSFLGADEPHAETVDAAELDFHSNEAVPLERKMGIGAYTQARVSERGRTFNRNTKL